MKRFIFTAIFLLVASQAMADFSAHIYSPVNRGGSGTSDQDSGSWEPLLSISVPGDVFREEQFNPSVVEFANATGREIDLEALSMNRPGRSGGLMSSHARILIDDIPPSFIALTFKVSNDVSTVAFMVQEVVDKQEVFGGPQGIYSFAFNGGDWIERAVDFRKPADAEAQWNTPVNHNNPHIDVSGLGGERIISFKGDVKSMTGGAVKILCFDGDGKIIKNGISDAPWQHGVKYVGDDRFDTPTDLIFGYSLVRHNLSGDLSFIYDEEVRPEIDEGVTTIPGKASKEDYNTSEIHVGLVVNEPQIVTFGMWTKEIGPDIKIKILNENRELISKHEVELTRINIISYGTTFVDIPFQVSGLHKLIFVYESGSYKDKTDPIHLFIRKQGDPHLRPFKAQDSVIMD